MRIVEVSENFLKAWEDGFTRAKTMLDSLYEKEPNKESFNEIYEAEIKVYPENLYKNPKTGELEYRNDIYSVMSNYLQKNDELCIMDCYNPATKKESNFWDDIQISRENNWNTEPPMPDCFRDHYISYAIHILFDHKHWESKILPFIGNLPFVAHNAHFDISVLLAALKWYELSNPTLQYFCSLQLAKRSWPSLKSHSLPVLAKEFGITYNAHNALDDAETCGKIVLMAAEIFQSASIDELLNAANVQMKMKE